MRMTPTGGYHSEVVRSLACGISSSPLIRLAKPYHGAPPSVERYLTLVRRISCLVQRAGSRARGLDNCPSRTVRLPVLPVSDLSPRSYRSRSPQNILTDLCRYTSPCTNPQNAQVAWRRKIKPPRVPDATQYAMRIFVGSGTEIPQFTDVANFGRNKKMSVPPPSRPSLLSLSLSLSLSPSLSLPLSLSLFLPERSAERMRGPPRCVYGTFFSAPAQARRG